MFSLMPVTSNFTDLQKQVIVTFGNLQKIKDFVLLPVDFVEMSYLYDSPPKVIWLRCGNAPSLQVESILRTAREAIQNLLDNPSVNCIELY